MLKLREDLNLIHDTDDAESGAPIWKIYDKARHRYFQIGWLEFEILSRWAMQDKEAIVKDINANTTLNIDKSHIDNLEVFLVQQQLVQTDDIDRLEGMAGGRFSFKKLSTGYLFFYLPLLSPDKFLTKTLPIVKRLFNRTTFYLLCICGLLGIYLVSRQWEQFILPFANFFSLEGIVLFVVAIAIVKTIHEFAHAYVAKNFGCKVSTIGVAFLVFYPVLYTDTTDAWKLTDKKQRLLIAAAGMLAELIVAVIATFLWSFLPTGAWQTIFTYIAAISWILSLFVNLNPLLRFDGYYLLADYLGITNLQNKAFQYGKWQLRKSIFGFDEQPPQFYTKKQQRQLLIYAYCTWVYRFLLMLTIAYFVYAFFFKVLGLAVMALVLFYFIIIPVANELRVIFTNSEQLKFNTNLVMSAIIGTVIFLALITPWHNTISAPAVLDYKEEARIYTASSGKLIKVMVKNNQHVDQGQILFKLDNPELEFQIATTMDEIQKVKSQIRYQLSEHRSDQVRQVSRVDLDSLKKKLNALRDEETKLTIRAPISGVFGDKQIGYKVGVWLSKDSYLGLIVNNHSASITAYLSDKQVNRVRENDMAIFYPQALDAMPLRLQVSQIDKQALDKLSDPYQASIYGGDIQVQNAQLEVGESVYRVHFFVNNQDIKSLHFAGKGTVAISGEGQSIAGRLIQSVSAVLIRESGF